MRYLVYRVYGRIRGRINAGYYPTPTTIHRGPLLACENESASSLGDRPMLDVLDSTSHGAPTLTSLDYKSSKSNKRPLMHPCMPFVVRRAQLGSAESDRHPCSVPELPLVHHHVNPRYATREEKEVVDLEMYRHGVGPIKRFVAAGALPHAVRQAIIHTIVAEDVAAPLQSGVFEVAPAH